jgi:hypothetical protein
MDEKSLREGPSLNDFHQTQAAQPAKFSRVPYKNRTSSGGRQK